jgi:hypothetical protein
LFAQLATGLAGQQAAGEAAGEATGWAAAKQPAKKFVYISHGFTYSLFFCP